MTDEKTENSRRKILKSAAVTAGIAGTAHSTGQSWSKPIIGSVVVPAHASMTKKDIGSNERLSNLDYQIG